MVIGDIYVNVSVRFRNRVMFRGMIVVNFWNGVVLNKSKMRITHCALSQQFIYRRATL